MGSLIISYVRWIFSLFSKILQAIQSISSLFWCFSDLHVLSLRGIVHGVNRLFIHQKFPSNARIKWSCLPRMCCIRCYGSRKACTNEVLFLWSPFIVVPVEHHIFISLIFHIHRYRVFAIFRSYSFIYFLIHLRSGLFLLCDHLRNDLFWFWLSGCGPLLYVRIVWADHV